MLRKRKRIVFLGIFTALLLLYLPDAAFSFRASAAGEQYTVTVSDFRYNTAEMPVGYFELSNGKMAFCACHEAKPPSKGTTLTTTAVYTAENQANELLRKICYYGFKGPGDVGASYGETALAISVANGHMDVDETGESNTGHGRAFISRISGRGAAPKGFQVYKVSTGNSVYQDLVFWDYRPEGKITLTKTSASAEISGAGDVYSLEGAVYGVYTDQGCTKRAGELKTGADGKTNTLTLDAGIYYVKEIKASPGYALDETTYRVEVKAQGNHTLEVEERPQYQVMDILTVKYDSGKDKPDTEDLSQNTPRGAASLEGAEFTCRFYSGAYDSAEELEGQTPLRTWVFRSGKDGKVSFGEAGLVSGDAFWMNEEGNLILPLGTLSIEETKAPEGYNRNEEIYVRQITSQGTGETVETYQSPAVPEDIIRGDLELIKVYQPDDDKEDTLEGIEGVVFSITSKTTGKEVMRIETDEEGRASTKSKEHPRGGLVYDTYIVEEVVTPEGYNPVKPFEVTISQENTTIKGIYKQDTLISSAIQVVKTDKSTGKVIPRAGAQFKLLDENKEEISMKTYYPSVTEYDTFTTDESGSFVFPAKLAYGRYYLREVKAPEGYLLNKEDLPFTVSEDQDWGQPLVISFADENAMGRIALIKQDEDTKEGLSGAVYEVRAAEDIVTPDGTVRLQKGELADTLTSSEDGPVYSRNLYLGDYVLTEISQPAGYVREDREYKVTIKYKDHMTAVVTEELTVKDSPTTLVIEKCRKGDKDTLLPGVDYCVWPENAPENKEVYTTGKDGKITVKCLLPDTVYCIQEARALPGYVSDETVYKVKTDEKGLVEGGKSHTLHLENDYTKYRFSKQDITTGKEIGGAKMILYLLEEDGRWTKVESWTSGKEPYYMEQLIVGRTYVLKEELAPEGYLQAEEIKFTVPASGEIQKVVMKDETALGKISVSKKEEGEEGAFLEDTVFEIRAAEDIVTGEGTVRLKKGEIADTLTTKGEPTVSKELFLGKYVVQEVKQTPGYALDPKEHKVELKYKDQYTPIVTEELEITNKPTELIVEKYEKDSGKKIPLEGVSFRIWPEEAKDDEPSDAAGEEDASVNDPDGAVYTTDEDGRISILKLLPGRTYCIQETETLPGYVLDPEIRKIKVAEDGTIEGEASFSMIWENDYTKLHIYKRDAADKKELEGAKLKLERIEEQKRTVIAQWTSKKEAQEFEKLLPGQYILTEEKAPDGYETADAVAFTLEESGEIQTVEMLDKKIVEAVRTGDDSLIIGRALLLAAAALLAGWALWRREER